MSTKKPSDYLPWATEEDLEEHDTESESYHNKYEYSDRMHQPSSPSQARQNSYPNHNPHNARPPGQHSYHNQRNPQYTQQYHAQQYRRPTNQPPNRHEKPKLPQQDLVLSMVFWGASLLILIGVGFASWFFIIREPNIPEIKRDKSKIRVARATLTESEKQSCRIDECEDETIAYAQQIATKAEVTTKKLPGNLRKTMGENNYRSAKIPSFRALQNLKVDYKVDTIINLAYDSMKDQGDAEFKCGTYTQNGKTIKTKRPCEPLWAKSLGLEYIYIPLTNRGPTEQDWEIIFDTLLEGNALVHCRHGADRTGAVIGRFRLENQPYITQQDVLKEALDYGFKKKGINWGYGEDPFDPNRYLREWMLEGIF